MYALLSATFLRSATARRGSKHRNLELNETRSGTPQIALLNKELRRFLGSPVYLTNIGIGILLAARLGIAYFTVLSWLLSPIAFLGVCGAMLLAMLYALFYRILVTWGVRKWEEL